MSISARTKTVSRAAAVGLVLSLCGAMAAQEAPKAAAGFAVSGADIHDTDTLGGGAPAISLVGARNGVFSGKVLASSSQAIKGLKATASDLKQGAAVIPASQISIRYAVPWDGGIGSWTCPPGADILLETSREEFRAGTVPIWITVRVPKDAKVGAYAGQVTVEAKGEKAVVVPVKLDVRDWTIPDTQDWRTWVELIQSPDTLAVEYGVPLWSERHWGMIAKSLQFVGQTGSRVAYVPLICNTNLGNAESMVRWVKKADGKYDYDFTVMDRYLDLAEKNMGKPKTVIFNVWEIYLNSRKTDENVVVTDADKKDAYALAHKAAATMRWELRDKGPAVTVLDPATKKVDTVRLPRYEDPAAKALWQPLWGEIRKRMQARGLDKTMMLGIVSDVHPSKAEVAFHNEVAAGVPWTGLAHHASWVQTGKTDWRNVLQGIGTVGYTAVALDFQYVLDPAKGRMYGWKKPVLHSQYWRFQFFNTSALSTVRHDAEFEITGNQRGIGHIGADFWPSMKSKSGKRQGTVTDRFPESFWHSLNVGSYVLGPGPEGPLASRRLEVFREGVQECEARITLEAALTDPALKAKLGADLAARAQKALDEQQVAMWKARGATDADFQVGAITQYRQLYNMSDKKWDGAGANKWFVASGWAEKVGLLYDLAGEAARKLAP